MINQVALDKLLALEKPSQLLALALDDLDEIHKTQGYVIDMNKWIENKKDGCHVCLAGSLMTKTLGMSAANFFDNLLNGGVYYISKCLDKIRTGHIEHAVDYFNWATGKKLNTPFDLGFLTMPVYQAATHDKWIKSAKELVTTLQEHDL